VLVTEQALESNQVALQDEEQQAVARRAISSDPSPANEATSSRSPPRPAPNRDRCRQHGRYFRIARGTARSAHRGAHRAKADAPQGLPGADTIERAILVAFDGPDYLAVRLALESIRWRAGVPTRASILGSPSERPVMAAAAGTVIMAQWYGGYGKLRLARQRQPLLDRLRTPLAVLYVSVGQVVQRGQAIARVRQHGVFRPGRHLHFRGPVLRQANRPGAAASSINAPITRVIGVCT